MDGDGAKLFDPSHNYTFSQAFPPGAMLEGAGIDDDEWNRLLQGLSENERQRIKAEGKALKCSASLHALY